MPRKTAQMMTAAELQASMEADMMRDRRENSPMTVQAIPGVKVQNNRGLVQITGVALGRTWDAVSGFDLFDAFMKLFLVFCVLLVIAIPVVIWKVAEAEAKQPHYLLNKSDWTCTKSETRVVNSFMPIVAGKTVMVVPTVSSQRVCVRYEEKGSAE